jgi:glycogen(starch) synthase
VACCKSLQIVLAGFYPPPYGGESVHVLKLAFRLRLAGILKRVVNLRRGALSCPDYVDGAGPVRFGSALMRLLSKETMLHLHTNGHSWKSWAMALCAASVLRIRGRPGVLTLHSGMSPGFLATVSARGVVILRFALASFAHVVCVNDEIKQALASLRVPDDRLAVVPAFLGVTPRALDDEEEWMPRGFHPILSVVAGTGPEYGLPVLIEALQHLRARYPEIGCVILGTDGAGAPADMVQTLDLSKHVLFLGQLPHEQCLAFMARSDLFVRPSLADGDAISVREALSMGVPVVASDTAPRPPQATLFRSGDSADLEDKVVMLLRSAPTAREPSPEPDFGEAILAVYRKVAEEWKRG